MKGLKFTRANIDELKPGPREYFAWSQDLPGFGIRVAPSGRRSFLVQFRDAAGRSCRRSIGDLRLVPLTIAQTRAEQLLLNAKVHGVDLIRQEKADARTKLIKRATTIAAIAEAYLAEPETRKKRSHAEIARYLRTVWIDVHTVDAEEATRHDLIPTLRRIASERGGVTANRARAAMSAMFVWAIRHGMLRRDNSPTSFLPSWEETPRERALSLAELGQIWRAAPEVNVTFGAVIKLLVLTACRRSEIADLEWGEVDLARGLIELPGARTKNGLAHVIPLSAPALAILAGMPRTSVARVFPGFRSWSWAKNRLDHLVRMKAWTIHDIRRTAVTGWHEELRADSHLVELAVNHVSGSRSGVAGSYDRSERLDERRALLERWADLILEAAGETAANVVPLGRRGS